MNEPQITKRVMVTVPGKDYDRAFWPQDVRYIEGTENGSRIHLFDEKDRVTLFTPLAVADVINVIQEITDPPMIMHGSGPKQSYYQPDKAVQP